MIQSVHIQRFKNLTGLKLDLGRVTALVGSNNAGKSSILQALQFSTSVAQSLKLDGVARWKYDGTISGTLAAEQLVYSPMRDVHALAQGGRLKQTASSAIVISLTEEELGTAVTEVRRGKNKNINVSITGKVFGRRLEPLTEPFSVLAPGLAGIPAFEELKSQGLVRRAAAKGDANGVFRNILWTLNQDPIAWSQFSNRLKRLFPKLSIVMRFDSATDEVISAFAVRDGVYLPIDSCGTGVLQAIQILAYIGVYSPRLLLLDEPDSHLHPDNQRKLAQLLCELSVEHDFQVLVSTHSRHFLDELETLDAEIRWIDAGISQVETFDRVDILLGLGALDATDRLRNGQTPWIILTEDKNPELLRTLVESSGLPSDQYDIWSYQGCTKIDAALVLGNFIREHAPGTRVLVHRDRDYLDDTEVQEFASSLQAHGLQSFVTTGTDTESHFLVAAYWSTIIPDLSVERAQELLDEATTLTNDKSVEKFNNSRVAAAQRNRNKTGGGEVNYGSISRQCSSEMMANPIRFRHGKTVLKKLKVLLQDEFKKPVHAMPASREIKQDYLESLFL